MPFPVLDPDRPGDAADPRTATTILVAQLVLLDHVNKVNKVIKRALSGRFANR